MKKILILILLLFIGCTTTNEVQNNNQIVKEDKIEKLDFEPFYQNEKEMVEIDIVKIPQGKYKAVLPVNKELKQTVIDFVSRNVKIEEFGQKQLNKTGILYFSGNEYYLLSMSGMGDLGDIQMSVTGSRDSVMLNLSYCLGHILNEVANEHLKKENSNVKKETDKVATTQQDETTTITKAKLTDVVSYGTFTDGNMFYTISGVSINKLLKTQLKDKLSQSFFDNLNSYIKNTSKTMELIVKE